MDFQTLKKIALEKIKDPKVLSWILFLIKDKFIKGEIDI